MRHSLLQCADFFRADNPEGIEARNEVSLYGILTVFEGGHAIMVFLLVCNLVSCYRYLFK